MTVVENNKEDNASRLNLPFKFKYIKKLIVIVISFQDSKGNRQTSFILNLDSSQWNQEKILRSENFQAVI